MGRRIAGAAVAVAAVLAAIILVAAAVLSFAAALYLYLRPLVAEPAAAALLVGIAGLALAALILLAAWVATGGGWQRLWPAGARRPDGDATALAAALGEISARKAAVAAETHPFGAFAIAFIAGLALGGSNELRKALKSAVQQ